jgi:hypothetical protein
MTLYQNIVCAICYKIKVDTVFWVLPRVTVWCAADVSQVLAACISVLEVNSVELTKY